MTLELMMDEPLAKIIEFLLENPVMDYSKTDLSEETGISRSTIYRKWDVLEQFSIIMKTRKYQNTQLYKLDIHSPVVNEIGRLKQELEREIQIKEERLIKVTAS